MLAPALYDDGEGSVLACDATSLQCHVVDRLAGGRSCQVAGRAGGTGSGVVGALVLLLVRGVAGLEPSRAPTLTYATSYRGFGGVIWRRSGCGWGEGSGAKLVAA